MGQSLQQQQSHELLLQPDPFAQAKQRDPLGHSVHMAMLLFLIGMLPFGTAPFAILTAIVMGYVVLRLWATYRAVGTLVHQPIFWTLLALVAVHLISLTWSRDAHAGLSELETFRLQIPFLIAFWPHHREARKLIWTLGIGVGVMAIVQMLQMTLGGAHFPMFFWWHGEVIPDRYPGMLHPNSTAIIAMTALLLLPTLLGGKATRWQNIFGTLLIAGALISIMLTGSRSEWAAAMAGITAWPIALWWMHRKNRQSGRSVESKHSTRDKNTRLWLSIIAGIMVVAFTAFFARNLIATRVDDAINEMRSMTTTGDVSTDVGGRLNQFIISSHLIAEHPFIGIGVGSYAIEARKWLESQKGTGKTNGASNSSPKKPEHLAGFLEQPHSSLLYEFDSLGLLGGIVFMALWVVMIFQCTERQADGGFGRMVYLPAVIGLIFAHSLDMHWTTSPGNMVIMLVVLFTMHDRYEDERLRSASAEQPSQPMQGASAT